MLAFKKITSNFKDLSKVETLAIEAFPPKEYISPSDLIKMSEKDGFDFLALYDGMLFVGFMAVMTYKSMAYLFFLAIDKARRSHGYGSQALKLLKDTYPNYQQTVDMEMLEAKAPNNLQRQKRRAFYLRNGYQATGKFLSYLGVNYEILCKDQHFDFNLYKEMMTQVKVKGFYPKYFDEKTIKNQ